MLVCTMMSKDSGTRTCSKKPSGVRHTSILTMVVNNKKSSDWRDNCLFVAGAEFLMQNVRDPNTYKCSLVVTRDGKAIKIQRSLFSECFYLMAMSEVGRATGVEKYKVR